MRKQKLVFRNILFFSSFLFVNFFSPGLAFSQGNECTGALNLSNVVNFCSAKGAYTNVGASASFYGAPSCWNAVNNDVWFQFTAIATDVKISINGNVSGNGTLNSPQVALYSGSCPGTIQQQACGVYSPGNNFVSIYKSPLIIGAIYYIRVSGANNNTGTFQLCINNYTPPVSPGQDCSTASFLCNNKPISLNNVTGAGNDNREAAGTCMDPNGSGPTEGNAAWFTWIAATSGTLTFTITPTNPDDDLDFVLFELPSGNCAAKTWLRCSAAGEIAGPPSPCLGPTGLNMTSTDLFETRNCGGGKDNFVRYVDMVAGKQYGLLINNFSSSNNGFNLSFGGTGTFLGPAANFTSSSEVCEGTNITYTDSSTGALTYDWDFGAGASPANASTVGPHHVSYSAAGSKTVVLTITGQGGCKVTSVKTITVNALPTITATDSSTICTGSAATLTADGATSYSWSPGTGLSSVTGSPVTASPTATTTYTVIGTASNGCTNSAPATVTVIAKPSVSITTGASAICSGHSTTLTANGASTYSWSPGTGLNTTTGSPVIADPTSTTAYTVTATASNGCTNTESVTVTVNTTPVINLSSTSATICTGASTTLTAGGASTYSWSPGTGLSATTGSPVTANPTTNTTYTVTGTAGNGCTNTGSVTVTVNTTPVINLSAALATICTGASTTLTASGASTYSWSPGTGLSATTGSPVTANPTTNTTYTVTGTASNGCNNTAVISVTTLTTPTINISAGSSIICMGLSTQLTATGAASYSWSPATGLNATTGSPVTASPTASTTYTITGTASNGCTASATVAVNIIPLPSVAIGATSATVCNGTPTTLTASGAASYTWNGTGLNPMTGSPVTANPTTTTTYTVTGTAATGCKNTSTLTITVYALPEIDTTGISFDSSLCNKKTGAIKGAKVKGGTSPYTYVWTDKNGKVVGNGPDLVNVDSGIYILTVIDARGCRVTATGASFTVKNSQGVYAAFEASPIYGETPLMVSFKNLSIGASKYLWDFGDPQSGNNNTSTLKDPTHTYKVKGNYKAILTARNDSDCVDTASITIIVLPKSVVIVPNVITPNGDGKNDKFKPKLKDLAWIKGEIYNRWGQKMFEWDTPEGGWDGTSASGLEVPAGTYYYIIHAEGEDKKPYLLTGFFTLIR